MAKNEEKQTHVVPDDQKTAKRFSFLKVGICLVGALVLTRHILSPTLPPQWSVGRKPGHSAPRCPQVEPLFPSKTSKELDEMAEYLDSNDFREVAIERLSGAVKIPTQSFDDMGEIGTDPRWDVFYPFAEYLAKTYPLTHSTLQLEKVNTHGLLYNWAGTDPALKPNLLMAHMDVVPVAKSTESEWTHPPFSGYYDGKFIWGRGASDCKNQLTAILSATEALVSAGYTPRRTLILSFGFDEEISGGEGAQHLSKHLLSKYGHNSIAAIVDEGAVNVESWGANFALPGVAEKGYIDVDITVRMPGGHSSIPPKHNGIGVAAELISLIEANSYEPYLSEENPYLELLHCGAEHAPKFPHHLKKLLDKKSSRSATCMKKDKKDHLAIEAGKAGPEIKYLFTTSVAVDLIQGGVKNNALPERTQFTVNHRINVGASSDVVRKHIAHLAEKVANKHNLTLHAFNGQDTPSSITLSSHSTTLEPAPVTPSSLHPASNSSRVTPFNVLSGTTRALYGTELLVSPGIMTGNTDTRYYWDLSEHIFRYGPGWDQDQVGLGSIHTVNERVGVQAHLDTTKWMWNWIRNMDEAQL